MRWDPVRTSLLQRKKEEQEEEEENGEDEKLEEEGEALNLPNRRPFVQPSETSFAGRFRARRSASGSTGLAQSGPAGRRGRRGPAGRQSRNGPAGLQNGPVGC